MEWETSLQITASMVIQVCRVETLRDISPCGAHPELGHSFPLQAAKAEASLPQNTPALALPTLIDRPTVTKSGSESKNEPPSPRLPTEFNKPLFDLLQHFPSNVCHKSSWHFFVCSRDIHVRVRARSTQS